MNLNKNISENIHGKKDVIISSVLDTYKQYLIVNLMKIDANIEILGTPLNLVKSLGTGVKDFFVKPAEGIIHGPLDGAKGVYEGTKSLVKNTVGGALNTVSKITGGISKEILLITQDENYINEIEKKNMMDKPKNVIEGIGYGISSMMSGLYYGVTDVVRKPLEGAKKEKLKGFGKGVIKGLGGLVVKPVSGVVDLISKTTVGIKNTVNFDDEEIFQLRYPRPFYGKFKNIRTYNWIDAKNIYFVNTKIPSFQKKLFNEYIGSVIYHNEKGEENLLLFGVNYFYLIEVRRFELILKLGYEYVYSVSIVKENYIRIDFKKKVNGNKSASIKIKEEQIDFKEKANGKKNTDNEIKEEQKVSLSQKILNLFKEALNGDV